MALNKPALLQDIEDLHEQSLLKESTTYVDPATGFTVFTELAHLRRGHCCGNQCRHCPYGWNNVRDSSLRRPHKVQSGDNAVIGELIHKIHERAVAYAQQTQAQEKEQPKRSTESSTVKSLPKTGGSFGGRGTTKNVPYTRGGDQGTSQLLTGERRSKADSSFIAMGTVDELCSVTGVVYSHLQQEIKHQKEPDQQFQPMSVSIEQLDQWLLDIMSRLFDIGSHLAKPPKIPKILNQQPVDSSSDDGDDKVADDNKPTFVADGIGGGFDYEHVKQLEDWIDGMTEDLPELRSFLLPASPSVAVAQAHVARTVCRRAERTVVPLVQAGLCDPHALQYLNRLSDFFFTAARWMHRFLAQQPLDVEYKRPYRGAKQRVAVVSGKQEQQQHNNGNLKKFPEKF